MERARVVTDMVTARRSTGNIRDSETNIPAHPFGRAHPQGWLHGLYWTAQAISTGKGRSVENGKIADSKIIEIVAAEQEPKLRDNALRVPPKRNLKKDDTEVIVGRPSE